MNHEPVWTPTEVAALFGVCVRTVTRWADSGRLPHFYTPGGHRRYREADVLALRKRPVRTWGHTWGNR